MLQFVNHSGNSRENNSQIAKIANIQGYKLFILYDFLIQFSFIAMFIDIFIQMIFEEKQITEI